MVLFHDYQIEQFGLVEETGGWNVWEKSFHALESGLARHERIDNVCGLCDFMFKSYPRVSLTNKYIQFFFS